MILTLNKKNPRKFLECLEIIPEYDCSSEYWFYLSNVDVCNSWRVANPSNGTFESEEKRASWDDFHLTNKHKAELVFIDMCQDVDSIEKMFSVWGCIDADV